MFVAGFASLFADRSCGDVFINHKLHPAPWLDPVNDRAALVVVFRLFCSLFHRDGSKLNCCLGLWRPSCSVTLCLFVSFAQSILKTFCFYASGGGELSRFSQMLSYSHLLGEKRAILGFSIYIRLKIADFCVVRRNAVSSRARTPQVFHKNALYYLRGFHSVLKLPKAIHSQWAGHFWATWARVMSTWCGTGHKCGKTEALNLNTFQIYCKFECIYFKFERISV